MAKTRDQTKEILDRHLDKDFFCAVSDQGAPSSAELERLAAKHGCRLPSDFLAHSTGKFAGIYIEVKEAIWPRPNELDVGPFWSFLYAVFVYSASPDAPDWMNMEKRAEEFQAATGRSLIPCLEIVGDADIYLFDASGQIVRWDHETDELEAFDGSFFELLDHEVGELRQRKDQRVAGS
jgi:hypothetical protein